MGFLSGIGSVLSNATNIGLSAIPGVGNYLGAREQNTANAAQSAQQMAFQETMSNTAHQREVADLRKAGLNPMLSGMGGGGASTPSGSSAQMQNAGLDMSHAVSSALEAKTAVQNLENLQEQNKLLSRQSSKAGFEAKIAQNQERDVDLSQRAREGDPSIVGNNNGHITVPQYYKDQLSSSLSDFATNRAQNNSARKNAEFQSQNSKLLNVMDTVQKGANILSTGASVIKPFSAKSVPTTEPINQPFSSHTKPFKDLKEKPHYKPEGI